MTAPSPELAMQVAGRVRDALQTIAAAQRTAWTHIMAVLHTSVITDLGKAELREHRRRCNRCPNPPGYPKPLRANGADYHRRRNNRRRR